MTKNRKAAAPDDNLPANDVGEVRDDEGLLVDEYTSDAFADPERLDALDAPRALTSDAAFEQIAGDVDGIEEIELRSSGVPMDTVDTGAKRKPTDETDMGRGGEAP